jgi:hypothetical protein
MVAARSFDYASYVVRSLEEYVSEEAETRKATWFLSLAVYLLLCGFLQPMLRSDKQRKLLTCHDELVVLF